MALDVKVKIDVSKPIGKAGFGYPLLFSESTATSSKVEIPYKECTSLEEVVSAGFANTTKTYKTAALLFQQENAPKKIAVYEGKADYVTDLAKVLDKDWRQLIIMDSTVTDDVETDADDVAEAIEATDDKMFFVSISDITSKLVTATENYDRTVIFYYEGDDTVCPEAALVGASAGLDVGSFTYKNLILKGVEPQNLTDTDIAELNSNNIISVTSKAGDIVTTEGKTRSGEYIDIVDSKDYVVQNLEYKTQKALNNYKKIPYDNNGIAILESIAVDVMQDSFNKGIIGAKADGTGNYDVAYALAEDVSADDKSSRKYVGGKFSFVLAGAVHEVEITGEITI